MSYKIFLHDYNGTRNADYDKNKSNNSTKANN